MFGAARMLADLRALGYEAGLASASGLEYAVLHGYEVASGRFAGRLVDLALPVPPDFPRSAGASVQVRSDPVLLDYHDTVPGVRNIIQSPLGAEWRYWSHNFNWQPGGERSAARLLYQVNGIFDRI